MLWLQALKSKPDSQACEALVRASVRVSTQVASKRESFIYGHAFTKAEKLRDDLAFFVLSIYDSTALFCILQQF